jgi:hypothetical protein
MSRPFREGLPYSISTFFPPNDAFVVPRVSCAQTTLDTRNNNIEDTTVFLITVSNSFSDLLSSHKVGFANASSRALFKHY